MTKENTYCVIMAGGVGSRFWPKSRENKPKQFLDMLGTGSSLIQQTWERSKQFCEKENIFVVTNEKYRDLIVEQLPEIREDRILLEPIRKNTSACIAYAAYKIKASNTNANIIVCPADHLILKESAFVSLVEKAFEFVSKNEALLTMGIVPSRPDTGYGYIEFETENNGDFENINKVHSFTEKPDKATAEKFVQNGHYLWNAGIFVWNINTILKAFEAYLPKMNRFFSENAAHFGTEQEKDVIEKIYRNCESIAIDYGIMEKADNVSVIKADIGWSDLGTWKSLYTQLEHDENGNALLGKHFDLQPDIEDCIINIPNKKMIAVKGLKDYIIVDTENALLIYPKKDEQEIKQIVNKLQTGESGEFA